MWFYYEPKHQRSWWRKHSLDILTAIGIFLVFGLPVLFLAT